MAGVGWRCLQEEMDQLFYCPATWELTPTPLCLRQGNSHIEAFPRGRPSWGQVGRCTGHLGTQTLSWNP